MNSVEYKVNVPVREKYDVIVCGGGVAGIAAALEAARHGKKVMIAEKSTILGGLATLGLINMFVPMCNGRGTKIIKGMCEEFVNLSIKYGYDTLPDEWKDGKEPGEGAKTRYVTRFSPSIFALVLNETLIKEGVALEYDAVCTDVIKNGNTITGVILQTKSGFEAFEAEMVIDATGDSDILYRAGVPTVQGKNYFTYCAKGMNFETMKKALECNDISKAIKSFGGGPADLYGGHQPETERLYGGTTREDVSEYIKRNMQWALDNIKDDARSERDISVLPGMAQFRTTRHIDGEYTFNYDDKYKHMDDSVCAICDFDHKDLLFEVSYGCLYNKKFPNILAAGRCAAAEGFGWDVLRVIPPAILTGQAAGLAASMAIDASCAVSDVDIKKLQNTLESENVMIHFDDALIPNDTDEIVQFSAEDHI